MHHHKQPQGAPAQRLEIRHFNPRREQNKQPCDQQNR
ncbi:Uncharacterised protein [Vibrio cholerae]|nr:Uncharacterised protein [Vibrio cholerae]